MNRRKFLQLAGLTGGGLVASATMAEAGVFAEIASWLKRRPVWSIPKNVVVANVAQYSDFASVSDLSLATAIDPIVEQCANELAYRAAIHIHTIPYDEMFPELALHQRTVNGIINARIDRLSMGVDGTFLRKLDHCDEERLSYTKDENGKTVRVVYNKETNKIDLLPTTSLAFKHLGA